MHRACRSLGGCGDAPFTCMAFPAVSLQTASLLMRPGSQPKLVLGSALHGSFNQALTYVLLAPVPSMLAVPFGLAPPALRGFPSPCSNASCSACAYDAACETLSGTPPKRAWGYQPGRPRTCCCDPFAWSRPGENLGKTFDTTGRRLVHPFGLRWGSAQIRMETLRSARPVMMTNRLGDRWRKYRLALLTRPWLGDLVPRGGAAVGMCPAVSRLNPPLQGPLILDNSYMIADAGNPITHKGVQQQTARSRMYRLSTGVAPQLTSAAACVEQLSAPWHSRHIGHLFDAGEGRVTVGQHTFSGEAYEARACSMF